MPRYARRNSEIRKGTRIIQKLAAKNLKENSMMSMESDMLLNARSTNRVDSPKAQ